MRLNKYENVDENFFMIINLLSSLRAKPAKWFIIKYKANSIMIILISLRCFCFVKHLIMFYELEIKIPK